MKEDIKEDLLFIKNNQPDLEDEEESEVSNKAIIGAKWKR